MQLASGIITSLGHFVELAKHLNLFFLSVSGSFVSGLLILSGGLGAGSECGGPSGRSPIRPVVLVCAHSRLFTPLVAKWATEARKRLLIETGENGAPEGGNGVEGFFLWHLGLLFHFCAGLLHQVCLHTHF